MAASVFEWTEDQLGKAQGKITYLGEQTAAKQTVVYYTDRNSFSMSHFLGVQARAKPYSNDRLQYAAFTVTPGEFHRMLLAAKPIVTAPRVAAGAEFLSFTIVRKADDRIEGAEFRIGYDSQASGKSLYKTLIDAVDAANEAAIKALTKQRRIVYPGSPE